MGTPLPEPPDELPRPDIFGPLEAMAVSSPPMNMIQISGGAHAVQAGTRVWAINLDAVEPATEVDAGANGSLMLTISAKTGDRVRLVSRTEGQHSPPLDVLVLAAVDTTAGPTQPSSVGLLTDTSLPCLRVTPPETLLLSGKRATLKLDNQCDVDVALTRVTLRLDDQGFRLSRAPAMLAPGKQVSLAVDDTQGPADSERLDVVLLDVETADGRLGRYAIDIFSALK